MADRDQVIQAIRACWSKETAATPEIWNDENPSLGQCDVSAFTIWRYLGGELVLAKVFVDGEQTEHHYWNRIDGEDLDLTRVQFRNGENIVETRVLSNDYLAENMMRMKPDVLDRIRMMGVRVAAYLEELPTRP